MGNPRKTGSKPKKTGHTPKGEVVSERKIFVLDTNVPMHDPSCVFAFDEHDVHILPEVIEEIDNHKKGHEEIAFNSRQFMRTIDSLLACNGVVVKDGIKLTEPSGGMATGRLFLEYEKGFSVLPLGSKVDNRILKSMKVLAQKHPGRSIILVSKDINMRIKARMLNLAVEDYHSDMVIKDPDLLDTGMAKLPSDFWETNGNNLHTGVRDGESFCKATGEFADKLGINQFIYGTHEGKQITGWVKSRNGSTTTIVVPRNYIAPGNAVWRISARNREQSFALNLLMDPNVDLVTLLGPAGCGKTLLTLAAGFEQVVGKQKRYRKIVFTRTPVPVGEEIGFLPGTEEEKLFPWMGAFTDNLDVLLHTGNGDVKEDEKKVKRKKGKREDCENESPTPQRERIMKKVEIKSLTFMRGRSLINTFLIVDEAQNLTPRQIKMLVTRAGNGTKVILGNLSQIDTPYLTAGGSGLAYIVDRFKNYPRGGHLILPDGERSPLANYANEVL